MELLIAVASQINDNAPYLVGVVMPIIVDWLNKDVTDEKGRVFVTILAVVVATVAVKWNALTYGSIDEVFASAGIIFTESQVIYKLYFKDSALRSTIQNSYSKKDIAVEVVG